MDEVVSRILTDQAGKVLFEDNADTPQNPASLTKMMTLYIVFRDLALDRWITVPEKAVVRRIPGKVPQSNMGLRAGQRVSVMDLVLGMIVPSANDAAATIAQTVAPGGFVEMLNQEGRALGLASTRFASPSGLGDGTTNVRDMALLARQLWAVFPQYRSLYSVGSFAFNGKTLKTTNTLLDQRPSLVGMKTGTLPNLRRHLAAIDQQETGTTVAVVMNAANRKQRDALTAEVLNRT